MIISCGFLRTYKCAALSSNLYVTEGILRVTEASKAILKALYAQMAFQKDPKHLAINNNFITISGQ